MSYNSAIPINTDFLPESQPQIKANFQAIFSAFSKNHVNLNETEPGALQGMHNVLTLSKQTTDPLTAVDQIALYNKLVSNIPALFFRPSNNQTPIQLTYPSISTGLQPSNPDVYLAEQYSFIAGPFVIYTGKKSVLDGATITLTPVTTLVYVGCTASAGGLSGTKSAVCPTNISANTFKVRFASTTATVPIYYLAIGK